MTILFRTVYEFRHGITVSFTSHCLLLWSVGTPPSNPGNEPTITYVLVFDCFFISRSSYTQSSVRQGRDPVRVGSNVNLLRVESLKGPFTVENRGLLRGFVFSTLLPGPKGVLCRLWTQDLSCVQTFVVNLYPLPKRPLYSY